MNRSRIFPLALFLLLLAAGAMAAAPPAAPSEPAQAVVTAPAQAAPAALDGLFAPAPETTPETPLSPPAWQPRDACFIVGFCQTCTNPNRARPCTRVTCGTQVTLNCGNCRDNCVPPPS